MNTYELTVVLPGDVTLAKKKAFSEMFSKLLKVGEGKIVNEKDWGKVDLAYTIKKNDSGTFLHFELDLEPKTAKFIKDKLRLEDGILRSLLLRV